MLNDERQGLQAEAHPSVGKQKNSRLQLKQKLNQRSKIHVDFVFRDKGRFPWRIRLIFTDRKTQDGNSPCQDNAGERAIVINGIPYEDY